MNKVIQILLILLTASYYIGCNKVKFEKDATQDPCLSNPAICSFINGRYNWNEKVSASLGKVDILIVDDNSGSMSFEQKRMADSFSNFISALDSQNVDYRIGIITTDISSTENPARSVNLNGSLQDGNLIAFPNGSFFLSKSEGSSDDRKNWFAQTIQRNETLGCETFVKNNPSTLAGSEQYNANCPSGDERAIVAANMAIQANKSSFIRPEAHLSVVVLSDEDVRSSNYYKSNTYALTTMDLPSSLVDNVKTKFPNKTLSVHSIVVRPGSLKSANFDQFNSILMDLTNDPVGANFEPNAYFASSALEEADPNSCINQQTSQIPGAGFGGSYGYLYAILTRMTGGIEGDICATNYGSQLNNMGSSIADRVKGVPLRCSDVNDIKITMSPSSAIGSVIEGAILKFVEPIPPGTEVTVTYTCPAI